MEIKAPNKYVCKGGQTSVFLGGTIDMGNSENWQEKITKKLENDFGDTVLILNPRRDDWDSSWEQSIENKQFNEQVTWELEAQEKADILVYYFASESKSPITLLELGLFIEKEPIVYCPKDFYRKGNVDIVCERYDIQVHENEKDLIDDLIEIIENTEVDLDD